ncbi:run domain Beclin-1-interacting and cysteine-rich domain-containing protein [Sitophilus oryzae]|uniref:Run domain Beclin-1-interacting and cysteine-rich domain-containing protein n=1 Tax=Sitophilus oryzae TaxID=7048 RepID=A0A6J2Y1A6_SITOR|nr:run domain Beclin-1-interacting and cysteine-rich domain-containing protein [Sitophilus oryzae]
MVDTVVYQQYLQSLKSTVESLLVTQVANVWSIYGGLNRLYLCLEKIFKHGCKGISQEGVFFNFIQGLEWLQPEPSKNYFSVDCEYHPQIPALLKNDKSLIWLYKSLESHTLSTKLSWLLLETSHLHSCYESWAFLCQNQYAEATLICLKAVERNQVTFLSEINPCLFLKNANTQGFVKTHRRCFSFPESHLKFSGKTKNNSLKDIPDQNTLPTGTINEDKEKLILGKLKPWSSLPALQIDSEIKIKGNKGYFLSRTTPNTPIHTKKISPSLLKVDYNALQPRTNKATLKKPVRKEKEPETKIRRIVINTSNIIEHTPCSSTYQRNGGVQFDETMGSSGTYERDDRFKGFLSHSPLSMVDSFLPMQGTKDYSRHRPKRFIEDGGMSILPMATGYFPKPTKGQSLTSFLTSSKLARSNAELDRENAHFSISEAIISAMEQLKCNRDLNLVSDEQLDDSDPEIMDLKQRIRLRRRQRYMETKGKQWCGYIISDERTDTTVSPKSTPPDTASYVSSSEDIDDIEIDEATANLGESQGLSMSLASLYSDADIVKKPRGVPDGASDILSAEGVALSLISKFNEKHLPKASDLEWLVSEEDAPQALLPLPKSWPVDLEKPTTPLRGTKDWAPPRPQIVLALHPAPARKALMEKQNYRCAGCGMKVAQKYASKYRYCDYLGKYFCTGCHKNQVALIPARVLYKWDFKGYPVSTFSYKLLEQMYFDPLFRIFELNTNITKLCSNLDFIRKYRLGLCYLKEYIVTCRFAETIQERLEQDLPSYFLSKLDEYSMDDLVNIKNGDLKTKLKFLVDICCRHTSECKLCLARGFICEVCKSDEVIFPWQMRIVSRCIKCSTCYHTKCWKPTEQCPKCSRIIKRKESTSSTSR